MILITAMSFFFNTNIFNWKTKKGQASKWLLGSFFFLCFSLLAIQETFCLGFLIFHLNIKILRYMGTCSVPGIALKCRGDCCESVRYSVCHHAHFYISRRFLFWGRKSLRETKQHTFHVLVDYLQKQKFGPYF